MRGEGCLKIGCNQGYGSSCLICGGSVICAPEWLVLYSIWQTIGEHRGQIYDVRIDNRQLGQQGYGGAPAYGQGYGGAPAYGGQGYAGQGMRPQGRY